VFPSPSPHQSNGVPVPFVPRQPAARPAVSTPLEKRHWQEVHATLNEPTGDFVCAVLLYSREWLHSRNVVVGGPIQLCIPQYQVRGEGRVVAIKPATTIPQGEGLLLSLVRQPRNDEEANLPPVEQREWQQVHILLDEPDDKQVYVVVLHSKEWLRLQKGLLIGGPIYLTLPQHEVHGEGRVVLIEPSPLIPDGEGRVMTLVRGPRRAPNTESFLRPGIRTYFGERLPPIGHEWVRFEFGKDGLASDFTLTRRKGWMQANWQAAEELRKVEESRKDEDILPEVGQWRLIRMTVAVQEGRKVHLAFFWKLRWIEVYGLTVDEPVYLRLVKEHLFGEGRVAAIGPAPFVPRKGGPKGMLWFSGRRQDGDKGTIADTEVGDYVVTYTPEERGEEPPLDDTQGEWISRERIHLHMEKEDEGDVSIVLLRESAWVQAEGVKEGGKVYLDMPEQGTMGWATVKAAVPCLVFRRLGNRGVQMVTGTFRHSEGWAGDLVLKRESKPIGVTPGHLFWSVDRQEWVPVGELEPGETVKIVNGTTTVESYTMRDGPEPVYNLEVEHDHVFRVGDQGVLVHNASNPCHCQNDVRHQAEWTLEGPRGRKIATGEVESGGEDVILPSGTSHPLTFPQQAWYWHTEGKIISELEEECLLTSGRKLMIDACLPPCPDCQDILKWASQQFKIDIIYVDCEVSIYGWENGVALQPRKRYTLGTGGNP
jgi:hypothetical protein